MSFVLASASPRRRELLARIGYAPFAIRPADIDETPQKSEDPRAYVRRMAREKAYVCTLRVGDPDIILAGDTSVVAGNRILGKPQDEKDARYMLGILSGRRHRVYSAIALKTSERVWERLVTTQIRFKRLTKSEIDMYITSGEWQGKAGAYAIQGYAEAFIPWISGSYSNVVGLPLHETAMILAAAGLTPSMDLKT